MQLLQEFEEFATQGNAVDLAVGVILGAGFNSIVDSLVSDIIMPPLGLLTGDIDLSEQAVVLKKATEDAAAVAINYGAFINAIIEFIIIAFAIFMVVRYMNRLRRKDAEPKTT